MRKRTWLILAAIVLVAGFGAAYGVLALARRDTPSAARLSTPSPTPSATSNATATEDLGGEWRLVADQSFVGYRVRERLTFLDAPNDAVGRTSALEGTLRIAGPAVEAVDVSADLRQLKSDEGRRDRRIRTTGLESDRFPTARFVLSSPITFQEKPASGETVKTTGSGKLTLHGVTRDVSAPLEARWSASGIEVVGAFEIVMKDYGITPPRVGPVLSISDSGTVEFKLIFVPS